MFGMNTSELLIILAVVFLLFGAKRLPELGKGLGEGMRSFRDAMKGPPAPPAPPVAPTTQEPIAADKTNTPGKA